MIKINVVFDNGGGTTIIAEGYAHYYSSPAAAAEDYIAMTSPNFEGFENWEGNEPDAVLTYDADQERNNGYLWLDNDDIKAEVKRDWGFNTETFYSHIAGGIISGTN